MQSFEEWLASGTLSPQTQRDYYRALSERVSEWANNAEILDCNILDISDVTMFSVLLPQIKQLDIFIERNSKENNRFSAALNQYSSYLQSDHQSSINSQISEIRNDSQLSSTEKDALIKARVGQGRFRRQLIEKWNKCCLLGVRDILLLTASHIKPWSSSTNEERLDVFNGLLLSSHVDKAFDRGLIAFANDGRIIISNKFQDPNLLGIHNDLSVAVEDMHIPYLEYHRETIFKDA